MLNKQDVDLAYPGMELIDEVRIMDQMEENVRSVQLK